MAEKGRVAEMRELEVGHIPPPEPKPPEELPNKPPPVLLAPKGDEVLPKPIIDEAQRCQTTVLRWDTLSGRCPVRRRGPFPAILVFVAAEFTESTSTPRTLV
jgi:hypothetical protein